MPIWLRLTRHFGLSDEAAQTDNLFLDSLGPILRADGSEIVESPPPAQFRALLKQLEHPKPNSQVGRAIVQRHRPRVHISDVADNTTTATI
jgi:hypothetical protein